MAYNPTIGKLQALGVITANSSTQIIYIDTVTLWNSANVNITIPYIQL